MALAVEASELMEPLQWQTAEEAAADALSPETKAALEDEMADVAIYLIRLADVLGVELGPAILRKLRQNEERFPVEEVKGRSRLPGKEQSARNTGAPSRHGPGHHGL
jgi:NTP pyrophosphatase (non-canonical NTP hydrolase)